MGLTFNLGRVSPSVFTDASLNVGIGGSPSGSYKLEVTGTAKVSSTLLVSGAATLSSTLQVGGNASSTITIGDAVGSATDANLRLRTGSTKYSWLIASQNNVAGFEITPSTAAGGTTYSTPALTILPTGAATFSSSVKSNSNIDVWKNGSNSFAIGSYFSLLNTAGTDGMLWQLNASNNIDYWGITSNTATASPVITFTRAGAATFSSSVTAGGLITGQAGIYQSNASSSIASNKFETYNGGATDMNFSYPASGSVTFTNGTPRLVITSEGRLGCTAYVNNNTGDYAFQFSGSSQTTMIGYGVTGGSLGNAANAAVKFNKDATTSRSINAAGSINASGADYAEYMTKAIKDDIAKGDIVGINLNGLLTNIFADSISFVVKSTNPSYVGGDTWGNSDNIGEEPIKNEEQTEEEFEIIKIEFKTKLEEARQKVDRIAFSGQVPCNVLGANVGDYIIPIDDNGKIKGQAITNPTFEQYQISIGKVWNIMEDGRAWIAVKIG